MAVALDFFCLLLLFQLLQLVCTTRALASTNGLVRLNDCICAGNEVTYECTVCGEGATVWTGSLLNCAGDEITLRHRAFETGTANGECNGGAVVARSVAVIKISSNPAPCFISQLSFLASYNEGNKTISCLYDNATTETTVDKTTVILTTEPFLSPSDAHITEMGPRHISFAWSQVSSLQRDICSDTVYSINATNCGICPNSTTSTSTTCTNITADGSTCLFAVETTACGNLVGQHSNVVTVTLKVPEAPGIEAEIFLSASLSTLIYVTLHMNSDGVSDSVSSYTITYFDTISDTVCDTVNIPVSFNHCTNLICKYAFEASSSSCFSSSESNVSIAAFASNIFGNGRESSPVYIKSPVPQPNQYNCRNFTSIKTNESFPISLGACLGLVLLLLIFFITVFIAVIVILVRGKAKVVRELRQAEEAIARITTTEYEEIPVHQQDSPQGGVDIQDNIAYATDVK